MVRSPGAGIPGRVRIAPCAGSRYRPRRAHPWSAARRPENAARFPGNGGQRPGSGRRQPRIAVRLPGNGRYPPKNAARLRGNDHCPPENAARLLPGNGRCPRGTAARLPGTDRRPPENAIRWSGNDRRPPENAIRWPGNDHRPPENAIRLRGSPTQWPGNAAWSPGSAIGLPRRPGQLRALLGPEAAPSGAAVPHRGGPPVRVPGPAMTCGVRAATGRRPTAANPGAAPRRPRPGTSPAASVPLRAWPNGARPQRRPRASCWRHALRRPRPVSPGPGPRTRQMTAASCLGSSGSYRHRRRSGQPSRRRLPGRRSPRRLPGRRSRRFPAARRVPQPLGPTSSICLNSIQTSEEGRSTSSGATLFKHVRRRPTLPRGPPRSTIGAEELNFRVRNGTGCFPFAITAETLLRCHRPACQEGLSGDRISGTAQWTQDQMK